MHMVLNSHTGQGPESNQYPSKAGTLCIYYHSFTYMYLLREKGTLCRVPS